MGGVHEKELTLCATMDKKAIQGEGTGAGPAVGGLRVEGH